MLRIARLTDRTGRYYLADMAAELGAVELVPGASDPGAPHPGRWIGTGAAGLGLEGPVDARRLEAVLSGSHPSGAHRLRHRPTTVAGYDLTFAAPKSVSILFGLGGPTLASAALDAHHAAVDAALGYVARRAAAVRVGSGEDRRPVAVRGLVGARFAHGVSRALDPHLHTHVVMANLAQDAEGRWRALDGRGLDAHARAAGALYDSALRHALSERIGARWVRRRSAALELASVDPVVIGALSRRRAEIGASAYEHDRRSHGMTASGQTSSRARSVAWATTRPEKSGAGDRTPAELRRRWLSLASDVGWGSVALGHAFADSGTAEGKVVDGTWGADHRAGGRGTADRSPAVPVHVDEHHFAATLHQGTLHAGCTRRDVVAAWAGAVAPGAPVPAVEAGVDTVGQFDDAVGTAEPARLRVEVLPSHRALQALGPRPVTVDRLATWQAASATVDRYWHRWSDGGRDVRSADAGAAGTGRRDIPRRVAPLVDGSVRRGELHRMSVEQLAEHLAVARAVDEARRRLGLSPTRAGRRELRSLGRA